MSGVTVHVVDGNANDVTSDVQGHYLTKNIPIGMVTLRFSKPGLQDKEVEVKVEDAGNTSLDVVMVAE